MSTAAAARLNTHGLDQVVNPYCDSLSASLQYIRTACQKSQVSEQQQSIPHGTHGRHAEALLAISGLRFPSLTFLCTANQTLKLASKTIHWAEATEQKERLSPRPSSPPHSQPGRQSSSTCAKEHKSRGRKATTTIHQQQKQQQ